MKAFASFRLMIFCFCVCVGLAISVPWFARVADCSQTGGALVCDQVNAGVLDGILSDLCTAVCGEFNDDKSGGPETSNGSWKQAKLATSDSVLLVAEYQIVSRGAEVSCVKLQEP